MGVKELAISGKCISRSSPGDGSGRGALALWRLKEKILKRDQQIRISRVM
jgi:hypothetical protein